MVEFELRNEGIATLGRYNSGLWPHVDKIRGEPGDLVVGQCNLPDFFGEANTNTFGGTACFRDGISGQYDVFGLTCDFDSGPLFAPAVLDNVILDDIAIRPEVEASILIAEQNPEFSAVANLIVSHHVISVIVPD